MNILPLTVLQVQFLCVDTGHAPLISAQQGTVLPTAWSCTTLHPKMGYMLYRDQPCSVASEWQQGFRSLCKVHQFPILKKNNKKNGYMFDITVKKNTRDPCLHFIHVSSRKYLFFPPLWYISPQNVGLWSSLVHIMWPNGSQTHCLGRTKLWRIT